MSLQVNDTIDGKYRIVRLLGEGGMGAVYEGENTRIHRRVAIKVLHSGVAQSKDAVERFEREAQAAGRIGSEHIVEVLDLGNLSNGERYMVMEFLEGQSLSDRIASRGRLEARVTAGLAVQLLEGLGAAHDAGIVHRDLKPDNVFLLTARRGQKDFVKIVDFGISKFSAMSGDFSMTRTGAVMGTPYYMAPEQAKGERTVDHRADVYSVGVILYEAATGKVPFDADTFNELLFKIVLEEPVAMSERVPEIDAQFSAIVKKAMAKSPAERYQSAAALQADLAAYLETVPLRPDNTAHAGTPASALGATRQAPAAMPPVADAPKGPVQTLGTWANTQDGALTAAEVPLKGGLNKGIIGAGVGIFAAAALGLFLLKGGGRADEVEGAPASSSASAQPASEAALAGTAAPAPPAVAEEKALPAPAKVDPPEAPSAEVPPIADQPTKEPSAAEAPATTAKGSSPARASTPAKTPSAVKAPAQASGAKQPAASNSGSAGRRIRTSL